VWAYPLEAKLRARIVGAQSEGGGVDQLAPDQLYACKRGIPGSIERACGPAMSSSKSSQRKLNCSTNVMASTRVMETAGALVYKQKVVCLLPIDLTSRAMHGSDFGGSKVCENEMMKDILEKPILGPVITRGSVNPPMAMAECM
jgi:hypothetical protein